MITITKTHYVLSSHSFRHNIRSKWRFITSHHTIDDADTWFVSLVVVFVPRNPRAQYSNGVVVVFGHENLIYVQHLLYLSEPFFHLVCWVNATLRGFFCLKMKMFQNHFYNPLICNGENCTPFHEHSVFITFSLKKRWRIKNIFVT